MRMHPLPHTPLPSSICAVSGVLPGVRYRQTRPLAWRRVHRPRARGGRCACVHVCMCACVHVCMCSCVHVCMCIGHVPEGAGTSPPLLGAPPRRVQRHTCTCTHAHMHTCTHAHMRTCTHAHMHTCAHTHMRTYMHIQTHAHVHTRMRTCVCVQVPRRTRSRRSAAPS